MSQSFEHELNIVSRKQIVTWETVLLLGPQGSINATTLEMYAKCDEHSHEDCKEAVNVANKRETHHSCTIDLLRTCSQLSAVSTMSENPVPTFVYGRRKKHSNSGATSSAAEVPENSKKSDCLSVVSSDIPTITAKEINGVLQAEPETEAVGATGMPPLGSRQPFMLKTVFDNGCSVLGDHGSDDALKSSQKTIEVDSINDSCSSSKSNIALASDSNMELASDSLKGEMDDTRDCSSSSIIAVEAVEDTRDGLSEKDVCISILRSSALLAPAGTPLVEDIGTGSSSSYIRSCKICAHRESTENMLICDKCEDAFHVSCCNPQIKEIPEDEWFCGSCSRNKQKSLRGTAGRKSSSITGGMSSCREEENNQILLMLRDTEPYKSAVAVGKGFQADVPDWTGPINNDDDPIGEPQEIDPSDYSNLHELNHINPSKSNSIGNWLQCRAVIEGIGEAVDGIVCGKWRRAPLFEEQTDNWECFSAVSWDPFHADCAVPQELETDQVLKQLKYVEMLRSRMSAKRRKQNHKKNHT
ncbi:hypothetical protein SLE2022_149660 [Rubroshorea leprosula]